MATATAAFAKEFQGVLDEIAKMSANEGLHKMMDVLRKHNLMYRIDTMPSKHLLCHPENRGGLMLSPHNVHRNAARIHSGGADKKQLTNALCIEMAPHADPRRASQIAANRELCDRSGGLLCPPTGEERFLTLGCGHTAAFCKLADRGGPTTEAVLADENGNIDLQRIFKNEQFKSMIVDGWSWEVVSHEVDTMFPSFAKLAQRALNVSNHVANPMSELEAALLLSVMSQDSAAKHSDWKKFGIEQLKSLGLPCAPYAGAIMEFVVMFGGGEKAPFIRFMDGFSKQFQCNVNLGESFWHAIASTVFPSKTAKFPLLRVACALANLTAEKKEDGVAKLLTKAFFIALFLL